MSLILTNSCEVRLFDRHEYKVSTGTSNNLQCKEGGKQRPVGQVGKILSQEFSLLYFVS